MKVTYNFKILIGLLMGIIAVAIIGKLFVKKTKTGAIITGDNLSLISSLGQSTNTSTQGSSTIPTPQPTPISEPTPTKDINTNPTAINIVSAAVNESFVVTEKALLYAPTWAVFGKNATETQDTYPCYTSAPQEYAIYDSVNQPLFKINTTNQVPTGQKCYDNHRLVIPVPFGNYFLNLKNKAIASIVAGFIEANENISGYAQYGAPGEFSGIQKASVFSEVLPDTSVSLNHSISSNSKVFIGFAPFDHVRMVVALIVNGQIYQGEIRTDLNSIYYGSTYQLGALRYDRFYAIGIANTWVDLEINPDTRTIRVVANSGNCSVSEKHCFISIRSNYNASVGHFNNNIGYYKHEHKLFNNKGNINEAGTQIINQDWLI